MEKTGAFSVFTVLPWLIITLVDFHSRACCFLQTTLHFLFSTVKGCRTAAANFGGGGVSTATRSQPLSHHHGKEDGNAMVMRREEVEMVMEKLGFSWDPNGEKIEERIGSYEMADLFEEGVRLEEAKEAFDVFDENCDGFIDGKELGKVLCELGFAEEVSEMEGGRMIRAFDDNGDGRIDFVEFSKVLENCSW